MNSNFLVVMFVVVTTFATIEYGLRDSPNPLLLVAMAAVTLFGIGSLVLGVRRAKNVR